MPLQIRPSADDGTIVLAGELDAATVPELDAQAPRLIAGAREALVLDVEAIAYLDSAGIGALLRLDNDLRAREARLVLRRLPASLRRVLDFSGMDGRFTYADGPPRRAAGA